MPRLKLLPALQNHPPRAPLAHKQRSNNERTEQAQPGKYVSPSGIECNSFIGLERGYQVLSRTKRYRFPYAPRRFYNAGNAGIAAREHHAPVLDRAEHVHGKMLIRGGSKKKPCVIRLTDENIRAARGKTAHNMPVKIFRAD